MDTETGATWPRAKSTRSLPTQKREEKAPLRKSLGRERALPTLQTAGLRVGKALYAAQSAATCSHRARQTHTAGKHRCGQRANKQRLSRSGPDGMPGEDPHRGERVQRPVSPEPPGRRYGSWRSRCGRRKCPGTAADLKTV